MSVDAIQRRACIRRREILTAANERGLTANGKPVRVAGSHNPFATVSIKHGPFAGWSVEYSWATIERATTGSGELL